MADTLLHCPAPAAMTISSDERQFFVTMGERIASIRKARNLTLAADNYLERSATTILSG